MPAKATLLYGKQIPEEGGIQISVLILVGMGSKISVRTDGTRNLSNEKFKISSKSRPDKEKGVAMRTLQSRVMPHHQPPKRSYTYSKAYAEC